MIEISKKKEERIMLHVMKDDFDESPEDILNSINNMLQQKEKDKENEKNQDKK